MKQVGVRFRILIGGRSLRPESELQNLQREVDRDYSVNDCTTETAGAWVPKWADEWIAEFLPNHTSLKKDSE